MSVMTLCVLLAFAYGRTLMDRTHQEVSPVSMSRRASQESLSQSPKPPPVPARAPPPVPPREFIPFESTYVTATSIDTFTKVIAFDHPNVSLKKRLGLIAILGLEDKSGNLFAVGSADRDSVEQWLAIAVAPIRVQYVPILPPLAKAPAPDPSYEVDMVKVDTVPIKMNTKTVTVKEAKDMDRARTRFGFYVSAYPNGAAKRETVFKLLQSVYAPNNFDVALDTEEIRDAITCPTLQLSRTVESFAYTTVPVTSSSDTFRLVVEQQGVRDLCIVTPQAFEKLKHATALYADNDDSIKSMDQRAPLGTPFERRAMPLTALQQYKALVAHPDGGSWTEAGPFALLLAVKLPDGSIIDMKDVPVTQVMEKLRQITDGEVQVELATYNTGVFEGTRLVEHRFMQAPLMGSAMSVFRFGVMREGGLPPFQGVSLRKIAKAEVKNLQCFNHQGKKTGKVKPSTKDFMYGTVIVKRIDDNVSFRIVALQVKGRPTRMLCRDLTLGERRTDAASAAVGPAENLYQ